MKHSESPTKPCPTCKKKGYVLRQDYLYTMNPECRFLPSFRPCKYCDATGYVYLSEDEIYDDRCARADHEAEMRREYD